MTDGGTQENGSASIPQPRVGAGSVDLVTETQDIAELRDLLARARERLSFYESFDRIVGENIKRSGELMLETIHLREQADATAREAAQAKAEFDTRLKLERKRHHDLLAGLFGDLDGLQSQLESFRSKLQATVSAIDELEPLADASEDREMAAPTVDPVAAEIPVAAAVQPKVVDHTKTIDALFHGIPDPGTAMQLQRHLNDVDSVSNVEAREFAEGILRLQVTSTRPLLASDFAKWSGSRAIRVLREQPHVIEATLAD
jgi:hypothetical protein